jgi:hypothetical protein
MKRILMFSLVILLFSSGREIVIDIIKSGDGGIEKGRFLITTALEHPVYLTN